MSQNDIRADLGLDPVDGGDVLYVSGGLVPVAYTPEGIESGRVTEEMVNSLKPKPEPEETEDNLPPASDIQLPSGNTSIAE